jgi:hypothetical protein
MWRRTLRKLFICLELHILLCYELKPHFVLKITACVCEKNEVVRNVPDNLMELECLVAWNGLCWHVIEEGGLPLELNRRKIRLIECNAKCRHQKIEL